MVIQIVAEHKVKSGMEREVLDIIREMHRKGFDSNPDLLWNNLLIKSQKEASSNSESKDSPPSYLLSPAKIRLHLSG